jgi:hypothetical protein
MEVVYLNKEQAEKVRGRHGIYSALEPILCSDGSFILPVEVLKDPEHQEVFKDLGECKYADIDVIIEQIDPKLGADVDNIKQRLSVKSVSSTTINKTAPKGLSFMGTISYAKSMPLTKKQWLRLLWDKLKEIVKEWFNKIFIKMGCKKGKGGKK